MKYVNKSFKKKWFKENLNGNLNVENENLICYERKEKMKLLLFLFKIKLKWYSLSIKYWINLMKERFMKLVRLVYFCYF